MMAFMHCQKNLKHFVWEVRLLNSSPFLIGFLKMIQYVNLMLDLLVIQIDLPLMVRVLCFTLWLELLSQISHHLNGHLLMVWNSLQIDLQVPQLLLEQLMIEQIMHQRVHLQRTLKSQV